jgi:hypothetical protein
MMLKKALFSIVISLFAITLIAGNLYTSVPAAPSTPENYPTSPFMISAKSADEYEPKIAFNSKHREYLVVWENLWSEEDHDVYARRVSSTGSVLNEFAVSTGSYNQMNPSVAYDPINDRYLVIFVYDYDGTGRDWDIVGRFIPWDGPNQGLVDFSICNWSSNQRHPELVYGRAMEEFLATWTNAPEGQPTYISARRIYANGTGFPDDPFLITSGPEYRDFSDVTYNLHRNEYLVTWDVDKGSGNLDIYGKRLDGYGNTLTGGDPPVLGEFPIAGWPALEKWSAVAACEKADQYLVAWQSDKGTGQADFAIYARYLNGDAFPVYITLIVDTSQYDVNVDVACNAFGDRYLLAYQNLYVGGDYGIWARTAFPNFSLGPEFEVIGPHQDADREFAAIGGGSSNFLMAWEHDRDFGVNKDIYGRIIGYSLNLPLIGK